MASFPLYQSLLSIIALLGLYRGLGDIVRRYRRGRRAKELGCQPVPLERTTLPLGLDMLMRMIRASREQRLPDFIVERYNAMGPRYTWRTRVLGSEYFTTADPRNIQAILATQFNDFSLGVSRRTNLKPILGVSVFALDGPAWHSAREVIRPIFSREQISDIALLERHFQQMLKCIPLDNQGWTQVVSLTALFPSLTLDTATELFLGKSTNILRKMAAEINGQHGQVGLESREDFQWAFNRVQEIITARVHLRKYYWLYGSRELQKCAAILHELCDQAIAEALQHGNDDAAVKRYDFLDALISRAANHAAVRDHVLGLLGAGRDTTAALTSWVFYCLIRHPEILEKLRGIIRNSFGPYQEEQTTITFESLKCCTYLQHILNETLRLHSVVPFNSRTAVRDTTLPVGGGEDGSAPVYLAKGTEVNFSTHVLHRRHDLWGPDADEFVPSRWEKKRPGWNYAPFNGGPRICLGQQYALTETGYLVVRILQRFNVIEGIDVDHTRDWHNFKLICGPGPGSQGVKVRMRAGYTAN